MRESFLTDYANRFSAVYKTGGLLMFFLKFIVENFFLFYKKFGHNSHPSTLIGFLKMGISNTNSILYKLIENFGKIFKCGTVF